MRQLSLRTGLDVEKIPAAYDAGVLTLTIPVAEHAKPCKIADGTGGSRQEMQGEEAQSKGELTG